MFGQDKLIKVLSGQPSAEHEVPVGPPSPAHWPIFSLTLGGAGVQTEEGLNPPARLRFLHSIPCNNFCLYFDHDSWLNIRKETNHTLLRN